MPDLIGFRKTSLVDYPGMVSATLFFPGCNLRCPWCHNPEMVGGRAKKSGEDLVTMDAALEVIKRRRAILGGVVISGGEPLLHSDIGIIIERIKQEGLLVKLDTNGTLPDALQTLLSKKETTPNYIAMDLKISPERYALIGGKDTETFRLAFKRSAAILAHSGVAHEFRSLALPDGFFSTSDVGLLAPLVDSSPWFFSAFRPGNCLDALWNAYPQSAPDEAKNYAAEAIRLGKDGRTR
ncbi:MAG: anaerobic ribonucleoside-triphosphate reductase activating protein [Treponemataceae bacterium]